MKTAGLFHRIMHPEVFQGEGRRKAYFEGWYFKHVSGADGKAVAVIPGIAWNAAGEGHAFIQLIDGATGDSVYTQFDASDFEASTERLDIRIGRNRFSEHGMTLEFEADGVPVRAEVRYSPFTGLPRKLSSPGIMGPYSWVPFMECYHGIVSLDHRVTGHIGRGAEHLEFDGDDGYIEKDWGQSFPSSWIWLQSNSFGESGTCLSFSVARIPWLGSSFPGFICAFGHGGRLYRFATYTGAKITAYRADDASAEIVMEDRKHRLTLSVEKHSGGLLRAPVLGSMDRRIAESIDAVLEVRLEEVGGKFVFLGRGAYTGAEAVGNVTGLVPGRS